jgi:hypothetical protein
MKYAIFLFLLYILCVASAASAAEQAQPARFYDPALCKQDAHGKRYISIGETVLGLPSRSSLNTILSGDKQEQSGCPDNPYYIRGTHHAEGLFGEKDLAAKLGLRTYKLSLSFWPYSEGSDATWVPPLPDIMSPWRNPAVEIDICFHKGAVNHRNGFIRTCEIPLDDSNRSDGMKETAVFFIINKLEYATAAGDDFRISCGIDAAFLALAPCEVTYPMQNGLGVRYSFQPPYSVYDPDLVKKVIEFDKFLRQAISDSVFKAPDWSRNNTSVKE